MKKQFVLFSLLVALSVTGIRAQEANTLEQKFSKHEIGVSMGFFSAPLLIPLPYLPSLVPNLNLEYYYNFNTKHSIGFSYSVSSDFPFPLSRWLNKSYIDKHPDSKYLFGSSIFNSIQLGYRVNFLKAGKFTFYSSFYAGVNFVYYDINNMEKPNLLVLPSLHITPIGFTYGVQNVLNFEVGIGARGLLIIGYRYHFNK
jgi:hypothetical protein